MNGIMDHYRRKRDIQHVNDRCYFLSDYVVATDLNTKPSTCGQVEVRLHVFWTSALIEIKNWSCVRSVNKINAYEPNGLSSDPGYVLWDAAPRQHSNQNWGPTGYPSMDSRLLDYIVRSKTGWNVRLTPLSNKKVPTTLPTRSKLLLPDH